MTLLSPWDLIPKEKIAPPRIKALEAKPAIPTVPKMKIAELWNTASKTSTPQAVVTPPRDTSNFGLSAGGFRPFSPADKVQEAKFSEGGQETLRKTSEFTVKPIVDFLAAAASKPETSLKMASGDFLGAIIKGLTEKAKPISIKPQSATGKSIFGENVTGLAENPIVQGASNWLSKFTGKLGVSPETTRRGVETAALPLMALFAEPGVGGTGKKVTKELLEAAVKKYGREAVEKAMKEGGVAAVEKLAQKTLELSKELKGAKPKYGYGEKLFDVGFNSDVDKALYIVAQKTPSKADAGYLDFLRGVFPGKTDIEIRALGTDLRNNVIKPAAKVSDDALPLTIEKDSFQTLLKPDAPVKPTITIPKTPAPAVSRVASDVLDATKVAPPVVPAVPGAVETVAKERKFITSAKEKVPAIKEKVAGQYIPRSTDELSQKAKNLINSDIEQAQKLVDNGTDENAVATASELINHYVAKAEKELDPAVKELLYDKAADIANKMAPKLTELGRAVQAASILGRLSPEGQMKFAAKEIERYNAKVAKTAGGFFGLKKKIPELTGQQAKEIIDEMKKINGMEDGVKKAMTFQKLQEKVTALVPTPIFKKVVAVWKAGLLTGIKTSGVNILANISHFGSEIVKDLPATVVDKVVALFSGERKVALTTKGIVPGLKEGFEKGMRYFKTGFDERNIGTKLDYHKTNFGKGKINQALQKYTDTIFRLIGAEDQPFYYAAKLRSLYEQAKVAAINVGKKGEEAQKFIDDLMQNPTDDMVKNASLDAETMVFQNETALGNAARKIQQIPGGEVVVPFGRTPSAVAMQVINYSPIGIVKVILENIGKGRFNQRMFSKGMGRAITGTGAMAIGGALMAKGYMTLARPTGEREQKMWELEGKQPNSIYDPITKKWHTIQVLGPWGNVLLIGGHFKNALMNSGSPSEAISKAVAGSIQSFSQQTFLTGVSRFIDAISDPGRSAESVAGSTLSSIVPTIVADSARAIDEKERRSESILQKLQARIPGWRESLEPQVDVLGKERDSVGNPLEIMADPTRSSPAKSSPVIQELRRLWDAKYQVSPTLLGDKKGYKNLTPAENTDLWKRAGEITNNKLEALFKNEGYLKLEDDQKAKKVEEFVEKSKTAARAEAVLRLTEGLTGEELKKKLSEVKKSGLMTREVFTLWQELR